jgi:hypothetical protein
MISGFMYPPQRWCQCGFCQGRRREMKLAERIAVENGFNRTPHDAISCDIPGSLSTE